DGPPGRLDRRAPLRTTPPRIRAPTTLAVLTMAPLFLTTPPPLPGAREGPPGIRPDAGRQGGATADPYFAPSDMDAQMANVLLIGSDRELTDGRAAALARYFQRRGEADRAVLQAAELARGDATEQRTVRAVLDALGRYERLAGQAMLLDEQSK